MSVKDHVDSVKVEMITRWTENWEGDLSTNLVFYLCTPITLHRDLNRSIRTLKK